MWLEIERKLSKMPENHPARLKFLDRVNYYGQTGELDSQGRVVIPAHLRDSASIVGDVRVFGRIDYLEVWNEERFVAEIAARAVDRRGRPASRPSTGSDGSGSCTHR